MARTVKQKDGRMRQEGSKDNGGRPPGFVELVPSPAEASQGEALCEIVLVSGHRLIVREEIGEAPLRKLVAALERPC